MSKRKAFVMPVVLILFALVFFISISGYRRYLMSYNLLKAKNEKLVTNIELESFYEILKTKKAVNLINGRIQKVGELKDKISVSEILPEGSSGFGAFNSKLEKYTIVMNIVQSNKDNIFTNDNVKTKFNKKISKYDIILDLYKSGDVLREYKYIDRENMVDYLFDLQFINFKKDDKTNFFTEKFFLNTNEKDYSFLYDRIFSAKSKNFISGDFRIYNHNKTILYIENSTFLKLLEKYISKDLEKLNGDLSNVAISKLDEFFTSNKLKGLSKNVFVEEYLLQNSNYILEKSGKRNVFNFEVSGDLYFDFDRNVEIYGNFKNKSGKIHVEKDAPVLKGIFVNLKPKENYSFDLIGLYFSDELNLNYKFTPSILGLVLDDIKIGKNYYVEIIDVK